MVKAILHGACGRMGHMIADIVSRDAGIEIVAGVDAFGDAYADFPVYKSIDACKEEADVIIDFSTAAAMSFLSSLFSTRATNTMIDMISIMSISQYMLPLNMSSARFIANITPMNIPPSVTE